jgi:hypothetical protein
MSARPHPVARAPDGHEGEVVVEQRANYSFADVQIRAIERTG